MIRDGGGARRGGAGESRGVGGGRRMGGGLRRAVFTFCVSFTHSPVYYRNAS